MDIGAARTVELSFSATRRGDGPTARGRFAGEPTGDAALDEQLRLAGFDAQPGQVHVVGTSDGPELWVGFGRRDRVDRSTIRRAVTALVRASTRTDSVDVDLVADLAHALPAADAAAVVTAAALSAGYRFEAHRSTPSTEGPRRMHLVVPEGCDAAIRRAATITRGVLLARDLVNEPGGTLVAEELARRCLALEAVGLRVAVHDHADVVRLGMGGLLGVNRGSTQPCAFVELHHDPAGSEGLPRLALVGKGITFDSGGINLKQRATALLTMKTDMGGAAAVIGAMQAVAELGIGTPVSAYFPLTDNMTGGDATRPGDVLRMYDGSTVEVVDTDAEGRLVLGDAVAFAAAAEPAPAAIVDVATLTHTSIHVTGTTVAPFVSTHDDLAAQLAAASAATTDRIWRMPRVPELTGLLRSPIADRCNRSEAPAASAFAALFVEAFAGRVPFAHIDMASVVHSERDLHDRPMGATGWGVELLVELVAAFTPPS